MINMKKKTILIIAVLFVIALLSTGIVFATNMSALSAKCDNSDCNNVNCTMKGDCTDMNGNNCSMSQMECGTCTMKCQDM